MKIFYQGTKGSYTSIPVYKIAKQYGISEQDIFGTDDAFTEIWNKIDEEGGVGIFPIENSYAGMVHENLFNFLHFDFKIIGEIEVEVNHCLLSKEKNISDIKKVFSHYQALNQCYKFCIKNKIKKKEFVDTAFAAKMVSESSEKGIGAIASKEAGELFGLNIVESGIQDQKGNVTKMFIVGKKDCGLDYKEKNGKISILFELKDKPASLYNCLGVFAENNLNLTKIESMPNIDKPFNHLFYIAFEGKSDDENVKNLFEKLKTYTQELKILGEY